MKTPLRFLLALLAALPLPTAVAQTPKPSDDLGGRSTRETAEGKATAAEKWISLFDGRTLTGWHQLDGAAKYEVRDGAIVGTVTKGVTKNSFLATDGVAFADFVFECEFTCDPGINSGVQFRSTGMKRDVARVNGYQYEIDPTPRALTGGIQEEGGRNWLAPQTRDGAPLAAWHAAHGDRLKPGEWNALRIECHGAHLRTWLNGHALADIEDAARARGFFALQVHANSKPEMQGKEVAFRNLRVRELK